MAPWPYKSRQETNVTSFLPFLLEDLARLAHWMTLHSLEFSSAQYKFAATVRYVEADIESPTLFRIRRKRLRVRGRRGTSARQEITPRFAGKKFFKEGWWITSGLRHECGDKVLPPRRLTKTWPRNQSSIPCILLLSPGHASFGPPLLGKQSQCMLLPRKTWMPTNMNIHIYIYTKIYTYFIYNTYILYYTSYIIYQIIYLYITTLSCFGFGFLSAFTPRLWRHLKVLCQDFAIQWVHQMDHELAPPWRSHSVVSIMHTTLLHISPFSRLSSLSLVKVVHASCTTTVSKNAKRTVAGASGKSELAAWVSLNGCFPTPRMDAQSSANCTVCRKRPGKACR